MNPDRITGANGLPSRARHLLLTLATVATEGRVYARPNEIASMMAVTAPTVDAAIEDARAAGWLEVRKVHARPWEFLITEVTP